LYDQTLQHLFNKVITNTYGFLSGEGDRSARLGLAGASLATIIQKQDFEGNIQEWLYEHKGAVERHKGELPYFFLPYYALQRLASTLKEGQVKYGEHNWTNGFPIEDILNHGIKHIHRYLNCNRDEDHLGHAMFAYMASNHMYKYRPDMCKYLLGQEYTITREIKELHDELKRKRTALKHEPSSNLGVQPRVLTGDDK